MALLWADHTELLRPAPLALRQVVLLTPGERRGLAGTVQLSACLSAALPRPQQALSTHQQGTVPLGADHTELFRSALLALRQAVLPILY